MKIIYEIDTQSENYDIYEQRRLEKALDMALALNEMADRIRGIEKYSDKESINIEELKDSFYNILEEHIISLDSILN